MALFKEKYIVKKFSAISSSDDYSASRVVKPLQRLPFSLQRGSQSAWFDKTKVESDKIIKLSGSFFYVPIKKSNFVDMMDTYLTSSLSPQAYTQISASFFGKMTSMGNDELIGIMAEDGPPPTASYSFSPRTGISPYTTTITNNSTFATGATHSIGAGGAANEFYENEFTSSFNIHFILSASISSSTITGSDLSQERGKILTSSYSNLFNGAGSGLGAISIKTKVLGDGELTDSSKFGYTALNEFLIFPEGLTVHSTSLRYAKLSGNVSASSPILVYHSGSTIDTSNSGSYLFLSSNLQTTASAGWYAYVGNTSAFEVPNVGSFFAAKRPNGVTTPIG
jgi:hypothetical protein